MEALAHVAEKVVARKKMPQVEFKKEEFILIHYADVEDPDCLGQYIENCKIWQHNQNKNIVIESCAIDGEPVYEGVPTPQDNSIITIEYTSLSMDSEKKFILKDGDGDEIKCRNISNPPPCESPDASPVESTTINIYDSTYIPASASASASASSPAISPVNDSASDPASASISSDIVKKFQNKLKRKRDEKEKLEKELIIAERELKKYQKAEENANYMKKKLVVTLEQSRESLMKINKTWKEIRDIKDSNSKIQEQLNEILKYADSE